MHSYTPFKDEYAKDELRGIDISPRPSSLEKKAIELGNANKRLLDIGCGTAYKTLRLSPYYEEIVGMDPSPDMLKSASANLHSHSIENITLTRGIAENLPYQSNQFDIVTAILTWWKPQEVHRVLKPNGCFLLERLGSADWLKRFLAYQGRGPFQRFLHNMVISGGFYRQYHNRYLIIVC